MKPCCFLPSLAACLFLGGAVLAEGEHWVGHKRLDCETFAVEATTVVEPTDVDTLAAISQTIRLINPAKHIDRQLDLVQHRSPNPQLGGRPSLDGMAADAACLRATTGKVYLMLYMYCANDGARTCDSAMDAPRHEGVIFYDDKGRRLIANPMGMTPREDRHLRALGLGPIMDSGLRGFREEELRYN
jgi:hypothetical protein